MSAMPIMVISRLSLWPIETETLKAIVLLISPTSPSGFMLSLMPPLPLLFLLELLHLAVPLCLPLPSVFLTTFQLLLRLLHHGEGITAHQPGALSFDSTRIFVAPNVLTLDLSKD